MDLFSNGITGEKQYLLQMSGSEFDYWIIQTAADIIQFCQNHDPTLYLEEYQSSPLVSQLGWFDWPIGRALTIRVEQVYWFVQKVVENPSGYNLEIISNTKQAYNLLAQALTDFQGWEQTRSKAHGVPTNGKNWTIHNDELRRRYIQKEELIAKTS